MIGQTIGNYRVMEKLGEGGMGAVYIAQHTLVGRRVAIKVLLPEFSRDAGIVNRFFNEGRATAQLKHPGIVELYDFGHHASGSAFIVMELLEGETLASKLRREGRLPLALTAELGRQIADALSAAHAKGIVHRDLKPDNVFLIRDTAALCGLRSKLLDFGIAKLSDEGAGAQMKTRTGAVMGTPTYMSPEQCRGLSSIDLRSDVYSLGCMLFEMASGAPPFSGEGVGDIIAKHIYEPAPSLRAIAPALDAVAARAMAKKPEDRYQNMAQVIDALEILRGAAGAGGFASEPSAGGAQPRGPRTTLSGAAGEVVRTRRGGRSRTLFVVAGAAALALGVGGWALFGRGKPPTDDIGSVAQHVDKSTTQNVSTQNIGTQNAGAQNVATQNVATQNVATQNVGAQNNVEPTGGATNPTEDHASEAARVALSVESEPAGAAVFRAFDGVKLGTTPFVAHVALGEGELEMVLKLAGHRDGHVSFPLDHDGRQRVVLDPLKHEHHVGKVDKSAGKTDDQGDTSGGKLEHGVLDPFKKIH